MICLLINNLINTNFANSPKRQIFLSTRQEKLKGLCKTRWVERHLETFGKLYEHVVTSLDGMVNPHVYPDVTESRWKWDSDTKTTAHGLKSSLQSF